MVRTELMEINVPTVRDDLGGNDGAAGTAGRLSHTQKFHQCLFTEA